MSAAFRSYQRLSTLFLQQGRYFRLRVDDIADGDVSIEGGYEVGHIFGDIHLIEPLTFGKLRTSVGKVRSQNTFDDAVLVCLVEFFQAVGEQAISGVALDISGIFFLHFVSDVKHRFS